MMPWFKMCKQKNTKINGVDLGVNHKVEIVIEEEKQVEPKRLPRKIIQGDRPSLVCACGNWKHGTHDICYACLQKLHQGR